jgi:hypothetical protein
MFRYKLHTLLIVLALGPPVLAAVWFALYDYWRQQPKSVPRWQLSLPIQNYGDDWVILPSGQPSFRPAPIQKDYLDWPSGTGMPLPPHITEPHKGGYEWPHHFPE